MRATLLLSGLWCAAAVAAGAFGAHALSGKLGARELALWETAARYLFYSGLGLGLVGLALAQAGLSGWIWAGRLLAVGSAVFAGTVGALALGGPRWLGALTPLGGILMIAGFLLFAFTAWRH